MTNNAHLDNFVKNIFEDNFAEAKNSLQSVVVEKLKSRMKKKMDEADCKDEKKVEKKDDKKSVSDKK